MSLINCDDNILTEIFFYAGPKALGTFACTSERMHETAKRIMPRLGTELARSIPPSLWNPNTYVKIEGSLHHINFFIPNSDTSILPIQGGEFLRVAHDTAQYATSILSPVDRERFKEFPAQDYCANPEYLIQILQILDKKSLLTLCTQCIPALGLQTAAPAEQLQRLQGIADIRAQDKALTTLPNSIDTLTGLRKLILDKNTLALLPESIGNLPQLQLLSLWKNKLTVLPESIGQLTNTQKLFLNNNALTGLPESIGNLTNLQTLSLCGNRLTTLPASIGGMTSLQSLFVNHNEITLLPDAIGKLPSLEELNLESNSLTALPKSLPCLPKIKTLDIRNNPNLINEETCRIVVELRKRGCTVLCDMALEQLIQPPTHPS